MDTKKLPLFGFFCALFYSAGGFCEPLFINSVASNDIDFIVESDPTVLGDMKFINIDRRELPDKRTDILFDDNAYVFRVSYADDTSIELLVSSKFVTREEAAHYAEMVIDPVGKLSMPMRQQLAHVVILNGNETAFAEDKGHFFVMYSENMNIRHDNNDLEETVFHESVHATLDEVFSESTEWMAAQRSDDVFITEYAMLNPNNEDLAESALFAYTFLKHPDRLPLHVGIWIEKMMPNRLGFFKKLLDDAS